MAVSLSEEIPDNVTEGSERFGALWMLSSVFQLVLLCMQGESELHSCVRPRQALDLPQVSSEQVHMILCVHAGTLYSTIVNFILTFSKPALPEL